MQKNNVIESIRYDSTHRRVYINARTFLSGIDKDVWEYIDEGGYQVVMKWLVDRKHTTLDNEQILEFYKLCNSVVIRIR